MENSKITDVRDMTDEEYDNQHWPVDNMGRATVIVLEDGTKLFASCDPEGNAPGFLFGIPQDTDGLIGATVEHVYPMNDDALENRGWPTDTPHVPAPPVLYLSTGHKIYPAADGEANSPGALFGSDPATNEQFMITFEEAN